MKKLSFLFVLCAASLVAFVGCGSKSSLEGLNAASGIVTLDGQPLADASITLAPASGTGRSAGAISDKDGKFVFRTLQANDGVAPGDYLVAVSKRHTENAYTPEELAEINKDENRGKEHDDLFPGRPEPEDILDTPQHYMSPQTSGLTLTIPEGGAKDLKIELVTE